MTLAQLAGLLATATASGIALRLLGVPGGLALGAMVGGAAWTLASGQGPAEVPPLLQDGALVVLGAVIGAGVTRGVLRELQSLLVPAVVAAGLLIAASVAIALMLRALGAGPPEDVLATSPGALSAVLAIALDRGIAPTQVALFHTVRLLLVIATLPLVVLLLPRAG